MANGFLESFAYGFFDGAAKKVNERAAVRDKIDAERKMRIEMIDPEIELERRKQELKLEYDKQKQKQSFDAVNNYMGGNPVEPEAAPTGNMVQEGPAGSSIDSVFKEMQKLTEAKAKAQAAGDTATAQYFDTQIDAKKQQMDYLKTTATTGSKPVTGAEGINIVEGIQKELDADLKNPSAQSKYYPDTAKQLIGFDNKIKERHTQLNQQHQALAQALATSKKGNLNASTPEVASTIQSEAGNIIKAVNTMSLNDSRITLEDKKAAAEEINAFFESMPEEDRMTLSQDPNFQRVFNKDVRALHKKYLEGEPTEEYKPTKDTPKKALTPAQVKAATDKVVASPEGQAAIKEYKTGKITKKELNTRLNALLGS